MNITYPRYISRTCLSSASFVQALIVMKQYLDIAEQGDVANAVRLKRESAEWFNESP